MRNFLSILLLFPAFVLSSQRLANVDAVFTNSAIVVRFSITAGPVCSGYSILHTADSTQPFVSVYDYPGICGDANQASDYSFTHASFVPNVTNFYRVRLEPSQEYSEIIRVYGSYNAQPGLFLYPNPMGTNDNLLKLRVLGADNTKLYGFLTNRFGVVHRELLFETVETDAQLEMGDLENGVYVLWLTDGDQAFSGKFIVLR